MSFLLRSLLINKVLKRGLKGGLKTAKVVAPLVPLVAKTAVPIYALSEFRQYAPWVVIASSAFVGFLILK